MKRVLSVIIMLLAVWTGVLRAAAPRIYCDIETVDELDGQLLHVVPRIMPCDDGYLWFATWSGLYRYDGLDMARIPARMRPGDISVSERFYNIIPVRDRHIWCLEDSRAVLFDASDYTYADVTADAERLLHRAVRVRHILATPEGDCVAVCADGSHIIFPLDGGEPREVAQCPPVMPRGNVTLPAEAVRSAGVERPAYAGICRGLQCIADRDGSIYIRENAAAPWTSAGKIDTDGKGLEFSCADAGGNLWFTCSGRVVKVNPGTVPYRAVDTFGPGRVRATMADSRGRVWIAEDDGYMVSVRDKNLALTGYLAPDGSISAVPAKLPVPIYSMAEYPAGTVWLGSKPGGLFRLDTDSVPTALRRIEMPPASPVFPAPLNIYDIVPDPYGRLWLATNDTGPACVENPLDAHPSVVHVGALPSYPPQAVRSRKLAIAGDSLVIAATTGGLLMAPLPPPGRLESFSPVLHVPESSDPSSPAGVAVSDAIIDGGFLAVATECGGVDIAATDGMAERPAFSHFNTSTGAPTDMTQAVTADSKGRLVVAGHNTIFVFDPRRGRESLLRHNFTHDRFRLTEVRPLPLDGGEWLVAHMNGAIVMRLDRAAQSRPRPLMFTSVSVNNGPDSLLSATADTLRLSQHERSLTLRFAALEFNEPEAVEYSFSLDGGDFTNLGTGRSLTLPYISPGTHTLDVQSTAPDGSPAGNRRRMTVIVEPRFSETVTARVLLAAAICLIAGAIIYTGLYIRRIRRRQSETLAAYLRLLEPATPARNTPGGLTPADKAFMDRLAAYIEQNISEPEISVDDMAAAAATSRSALTRKMKALTGISPAEFLKQSRLSHAAALLKTSDMPVKHIAADCGFSDLNYFGKCFKAAYGASPTAYRKAPGK